MKSPPLSLPLQSFSFGVWRGMRSLTMGLGSSPLMVLLLLSAFVLCVGGQEDWTSQCPTGCKCTWVSGKKTGDCRGSHWTTIPSGLSPEVQVLEMGGVTIKMLPKDAFKSVGLVNLQKVFLQNCRIERIDPDAFRELEIMIELDLSGNLISSIEMETFTSNIRLRELKLSANPLTKLTGQSFPSLMYLKLLDFSECHLSSLPKRAFEKLSVLETLSLSGNRFTYLSKELFRPLTKLKSLGLAGNPWRCDCRLKTLRDWVIERNLFQKHTKCVTPESAANFPWDDLSAHDYACRPEIVSVQINGKPTDALLVHTDIGSDITLQCLVRGNPPPDLKWVRDGQVLTNTSRAYGKSYYLHLGEESWDEYEPAGGDQYKGRWVNLTIQKTDPEDAGEYKCVGSNNGGVVEKNLTLNFQDVPSGAGVGPGLGGLGGGPYSESGWLWAVIISVAAVVVFSTLVTLVCLCSRRRRVKTTRAQDLKNDDQPQQRQLLLSPVSESPDKGGEDGKTTLLLKEKYLVGPDARSQSADVLNSYENENGNLRRPTSALPLIPPPPSSVLTGGPHGIHPTNEYPDLLDLPHTRHQESPAPSMASTLPDSTRMLITPQQVHPSIIVNPNRLVGYNPIYGSGRSTPLWNGFSPTEPAMVPAGTRPGYVTLPRRHRVPSWSPVPRDAGAGTASLGPPSPTGSAATVSLPFVRVGPRYDSLGPRTTADGSSRLSLNNLPDHSPGHQHQQHHQFPNHSQPHPGLVTGTLGRHNVLRSTPTPLILGQPISHFAPIQEVEPITSPTEMEEASQQKTEEQPSSKGGSAASQSQGTPDKHKKVPPKPPPKPGKKQAAETNGSLPKDSGGNPLIEDDGTEV